MAMEEHLRRLHVLEVALAIREQTLAQEVSNMFDDISHVSAVPYKVLVSVQEAEQAYQASNCFEAIDLLKKAVLMCENLWESNLEYEQHEYMDLRVIMVELKELTNKIRDSLIIRIQGCVQMGERESFEHELVAQHGGIGFRLDEWSQLMHSYHKEIRNKFPAEAFAPRRPHNQHRARRQRR